MKNKYEIWKDVVGYEGFYQVSNFGRVKRNKRTFTRNSKSRGKVVTINEKLLKPYPDGKGYLNVRFYSETGTKDYKVHTLVARVFLEQPHGKDQVNHKNGDKTDNRLCNLEYVNQMENTNHRETVLNKVPRGVTFHLNRWQARIIYANKCMSLGHFDNKSDAYKAYFNKFVELRGAVPWDLKQYPTHK